MTVKELIRELEKIENKELDIVVNDGISFTNDIDITETMVYYGKSENNAWTYEVRKCVVLD